ncbi:MAG: stage II sporulation protein D [Bacilli bacterium]
MKKLIYLTLMLIVIPTLIVSLIRPKEKDIIEKLYTFEKNTKVRVKRVKEDRIDTIPLEQYLVGVLSGEMPVSYEIEALKAQAVAARTYTLKKKETNKYNGFDVVDNTNDQVYLDDEYLRNNWGQNYETYIKKIKQAVNETRGEYLTYDGKIIKAFFFSTSSGKTENCKDVFGENLPYLVSVSSIWDENSPSYLDKKIYTKEEFYQKLNIPFNDNLDIEIKRNETNSIKTITINNTEIKGTDFRYELDLKSTNIDINEVDNNIEIISKGFGHGVGLSQYGAQEMALKGYKYDEILKYYYQGTEFKKI